MLISFDYETFELQEGVSIDIKPLDKQSYQLLIRLLSKMQLSGTESNEQIESGFRSLGDEQLSKAIEQIIPKNCKNLRGIQKKQNGAVEDASIEDLISHGSSISFFLPVLIQMLNITSISSEDQKTLKKQ